jgi:hypothetical protein
MKIAIPHRASHTYTQQLLASCDDVFPLLCPVREADWLDGWDPVSVATRSGFAERDCVFVTSDGMGKAVWYVTRHEPENRFVEMIKISPGVTACRIAIQVSPAPAGAEATITYTHTSLSADGDAFIDAFTHHAYLQFMKDWEARFNFYLRHGRPLRRATS